MLRAGPIPFGSGTAREQRLYRATRVLGHQHLTVDLLSVTPVLADAWAGRVTVPWLGRTLTVVSREGLGSMKRLSTRLKDRADLEALGLAGGSDDEP